MLDCYYKPAESDSTIDQQKAGLKQKTQSIYCYLKDALHALKLRFMFLLKHTHDLLNTTSLRHVPHFVPRLFAV